MNFWFRRSKPPLIEALTDEQITLLFEYAEQWAQIGLDLSPANRSEAEAGVYQSYAAAKLKPPNRLVWIDHPPQLAELGINPNESKFGRIMQQKLHEPVYQHLGRILSPHLLRQIKYDPFPFRFGFDKSLSTHLFKVSNLWYYSDRALNQAINVFNPFRMYGQDGVLHHAKFDHLCTGLSFLPQPNTMTGYLQAGRNVHRWWAFEDVAVLCERPCSLFTDETQYWFHREDGPAIEYRSGWGAYFWHGVAVPEHVILHPETISVEEIEQEMDIEVRNALIERYGESRYVQNSNFTLLDEDKWHSLYVKQGLTGESIVFLAFDHHKARRWMRLPPHMTTCAQAKHWLHEQETEMGNDFGQLRFEYLGKRRW